MASIDLMIERYSRIRQEEESKNGLIILAAVYGKIIDGMLDLIIRSSDFYSTLPLLFIDEYFSCVGLIQF